MDLDITNTSDLADDATVANAPLRLEARNLNRKISQTASIQDISLALSGGDILGLLGLNGAGKSTTLSMLCGVLVPDSGSVCINGYSMEDQPLQARQHIGYLPDQPPLYRDMRVKEYLKLTGQIRGLSAKTLKVRIETVTEQCDLGDVQTKLIGTLSKGFQQRVGLAQALIHEPAVVLLDEPSNGLDPQQMDSMRTLIKEVGRTQAVIFSTHLLSEARATCNRVAIIHEGKLVADRPVDGTDIELIFHGATTC